MNLRFNASIRAIDSLLHVLSVFVLYWSGCGFYAAFGLLPDIMLPAVAFSKKWLPDSDLRIRINSFFHSLWVLLPVVILFGEKALIAWLIHLLIDEMTH